MATMDAARERAPRQMTLRSRSAAAIFALGLVLPTVVGLAYYTLTDFDALPAELLIWIFLVALIELLPAPAWGGIQVGLGFPLLTAVAILYPPGAAALVAFLGTTDPREIRAEINPLRALFNRSQVAIAVFAASSTFHALSSSDAPLTQMVPAALVAVVVDYAINIGVVSLAAGLSLRMNPAVVLRQLSRGQEFLLSYVGLGLVGTILAKLSSMPQAGTVGLVVVLAPLLSPDRCSSDRRRSRRRTRSCRNASRCSRRSRTRWRRSGPTSGCRSPATSTTIWRRCCSGSRSRWTSRASCSTRARSRRR